MAKSCTAWKRKSAPSGASFIESTCGPRVTLQVSPYDWAGAKKRGPSSYVVMYDGRIVRHGAAKTLAAAKSAARRQAGATGGVP